MKILVTGSGGFIGRNIISFLSKNHKVFASANKKPLIKYKNIVYIKFNKQSLNKLKCLDAIVHCAARSPGSMGSPSKYSQKYIYKNNQYLDNFIISFAKKKRVKKFIYLSSAAVYGRWYLNSYINQSINKIIKEKTKPKNLDLYGKQKYETEKKLSKIPKSKISSIFVLRLSSILGEGSHNTFLSKLYSNLKNKKKAIISNKKKLFNACIHVNDLNTFIENLLLNYTYKYDIINVASHKPAKMLNIINLFKKKFNKSEIYFSPKETPTYIFDTKKAFKKYKLKKISTLETINKYLKLN